MVVEGEKTYINDQLIVWFNWAISHCRVFLAKYKLLIHSCGPPKSRILNFQLFNENSSFLVVLMKIPNF